MYNSPWLNRILETLQSMETAEKDRWLGRPIADLFVALRGESIAHDQQINAALGTLSKGKLIERTVSDSLRLTPAGWRRVAREMPGHEFDELLLQTLIQLYNDSTVPKFRGQLLGSVVSERIGWPRDVYRLLNIAERLSDRGLVTYHQWDDDVFLRPTKRAVQNVDLP
jgi:hypothetical protein